MKLAYPPNPEKTANKDLSRHAFTKQEINVESPAHGAIAIAGANGNVTTPEE